MTVGRLSWICESCGKRTDGLPGIDDAMDCFCSGCLDCGQLDWDCWCPDDEYPDGYGDDE